MKIICWECYGNRLGINFKNYFSRSFSLGVCVYCVTFFIANPKGNICKQKILGNYDTVCYLYWSINISNFASTIRSGLISSTEKPISMR